MSCCGRTARGLNRPIRSTARVPAANTRSASSIFEYIGPSRMTAVGGATGQRYTFHHPHARLPVDPRDRPYLRALRHLRELA